MAQRKPALWCSVEVHAAVDGAEFPATREELLSRAYQRNAPEGVLVALSQLDATQVYADIGEVCADVEEHCSLQLVDAVRGLDFPASGQAIRKHAEATAAPPLLMQALSRISEHHVYATLAELCRAVPVLPPADAARGGADPPEGEPDQ
jgi:hypothetical protein